MDARSRGRETDLRRRAVAWEPSADQSDGGAVTCLGAASGDAGGTKVAGAAGGAATFQRFCWVVAADGGAGACGGGGAGAKAWAGCGGCGCGAGGGAGAALEERPPRCLDFSMKPVLFCRAA